MGLIFDLDCPTTMLVTAPTVRERKPRARIEDDTPIVPRAVVELAREEVRARRIEDETVLVPRAVAESVCEEVKVWLRQPLPRRWVRELIAHANTVYSHNVRFRRKIRSKGNAGRDWLWIFMRHWLAALIWKHRHELYSRLPSGYSVGHDLPDRRHGHAD